MDSRFWLCSVHPRPQLLCMLQVQLQLVSAAVKLFLKKPTGKPQAMIQLVLTYATQVGALLFALVEIGTIALWAEIRLGTKMSVWRSSACTSVGSTPAVRPTAVEEVQKTPTL